MDYVGRQNIISPSAGISVSPLRGLTLSLTQYFSWRASDRDALYNAAGAVLRPGTGTDARYVGAELDLLANYQITRHLLGYVGYSHFFTGAFIDPSRAGTAISSMRRSSTHSERDGPTPSGRAGLPGVGSVH